jgi:hypothetical protein
LKKPGLLVIELTLLATKYSSKFNQWPDWKVNVKPSEKAQSLLLFFAQHNNAACYRALVGSLFSGPEWDGRDQARKTAIWRDFEQSLFAWELRLDTASDEYEQSCNALRIGLQEYLFSWGDDAEKRLAKLFSGHTYPSIKEVLYSGLVDTLRQWRDRRDIPRQIKAESSGHGN